MSRLFYWRLSENRRIGVKMMSWFAKRATYMTLKRSENTFIKHSMAKLHSGVAVTKTLQSPIIRLVLISDTHSKHQDLGDLPAGDMLIHAGDFTESRPPKPHEYKDFVDWFSSQPHKDKMLISGNRDQFMDTKTSKKYEKTSGFWMEQMQAYVKEEKTFKYLEDQQLTLSYGENKVKIFGSPWTAIYGKPGKAFQIPNSNLNERWENIPRDTDILITHMPPYQIRDSNSGKVRSGCQDLARTVIDRVKPKLHVFGHIHESYGWENKEGILFVNAASKRPRSKHLNSPVVIDYNLVNKVASIVH